MDQVFNADDAFLAEMILNNGIICDWHSLLVHLGKSTLVDELPSCLQIWVTAKCNNNVRISTKKTHLTGTKVK